MKIFFLVPRVPWPLEKGDKLRAYNQLKILSQEHEVFLCALSDVPIHPEAKEKLTPLCAHSKFIELSKPRMVWNLFKAFFTRKPFQVGYFFNAKADREIDELIRHFRPDAIYCQLTRAAEYVKEYKGCIKVLDYQDAFSKGLERRLETEENYKHWIIKLEQKRLSNYETACLTEFNHTTIISEQDQSFINHERKCEIKVVPNGVDFDFFQPIKQAKDFDLVFTGNMNYPPNVDCALYIVNEIMPLVWEQKSNTNLLLAGANPSPKLQQLTSEKVKLSGWVDDIRTCYASAKIFLAPMQIGTGLQNKLLEAMAMEMPCITSELANNALKATNGINILIGSKSEDYASHINYLLNNPDKGNEIAKAGNEFVKNNYSWEAMTRPLMEVFKSKN